MITSAQLIEAAELVKAIEADKANLVAKQSKLQALLAGAVDGVTAPSPVLVGADGRKVRGPLSPEAKKAIRLGQKRRWAKVHAAEAAAATPAAYATPVVSTVTIPTPAEPVKAAATSEQVLANA